MRGGGAAAVSGALDALPLSLKDLRLSNEAQHRDGKEPVRASGRSLCIDTSLWTARRIPELYSMSGEPGETSNWAAGCPSIHTVSRLEPRPAASARTIFSS